MAKRNSTAATPADIDREIIELARQLTKEQRRQWVSQFKRHYMQTQCKDKAEGGVQHG